MSYRSDHLYTEIVEALEEAGRGSSYVADANEPDPRYLGYGVRAAGKAAIIKAFRQPIRQLSESDKLQLAERLIRSRYGEQQSVALAILEPMVDYFVPDQFHFLDSLVRCLHGWSKIDSYTGRFLPTILQNHPADMLQLVGRWNSDPDMWLRRCSVVLFTRKLAKSGRFTDEAIGFCENLLTDSEPLVLKGVGWALKDMMKADKPRLVSLVKQYRRQGVSSTVTLYALRDLKGAERAAVLAADD